MRSRYTFQSDGRSSPRIKLSVHPKSERLIRESAVSLGKGDTQARFDFICEESLEFMEDGGYERPDLWLSEGWAKVENDDWKAPFYWERIGSQWHVMTLAGMRPVEENEPIVHVTYFEADAYSRWAGVHLPTEFEWEVAASVSYPEGNFVDDGYYHPIPAREVPEGTLSQMYGDVWEWTRSSYAPYPGYYPIEGALGEYNGKIISNQYVLRGGCCATSSSHIRPTNCNFFLAESAWMYSGILLAGEA